jgi:hypothetical protein
VEEKMAFSIVSQKSIIKKMKDALHAISKLAGFIRVVFCLTIVVEFILKICKIGYAVDWQWYVLHIYFVVLLLTLMNFYILKKVLVELAMRGLILPKDLQNFILFLFDRETRKSWKKLKAEDLEKLIKWTELGEISFCEKIDTSRPGLSGITESGVNLSEEDFLRKYKDSLVSGLYRIKLEENQEILAIFLKDEKIYNTAISNNSKFDKDLLEDYKKWIEKNNYKHLGFIIESGL